jgi:ElaA protein
MKLRQKIFVVEQNCAYLDCDDKDYLAWHLLAWQDYLLVAYARLLPEGASFENCLSIGRVVSAQELRGKGVGRQLMRQAIHTIYELYGYKDIKIAAQSYLLRFYESFGFVSTGHEYLEDNIPHTDMLLKAPLTS